MAAIAAYVTLTKADLLQFGTAVYSNGQVTSNATGVGGTIQYVQDGNGVATALGLSTAGVTVNGTFKIGTSTITLGGSVTYSGAYAFTGTLTAATTVTFPTTGTLSTLAGSETLTNKTLTTPVIATISNTGTLTLPTSTDTLVGRNTTDTLTNKTLVAPVLGTIASGNLASGTGYTIANIAGLGTGVGTFLATPSSANLLAALTTKTGTGSAVFAISPTLVTPVLGVATITSLNGAALSAAPNLLIQRVSTEVVTSTTGTTILPIDDTIPQITEGTEFMTLAITPKNALNILVIDAIIYLSYTASATLGAALFQDATAGALAASAGSISASGEIVELKIRHIMVAGTGSTTTFRVRGGAAAGTVTFNGSLSSRVFGGVLASCIMISEYTP